MEYPSLFKRQRKEFVVAALTLIAACSIFFAKGIFLGRRAITWDAADQFFPFLWFNGKLWSNLKVPLWNPFLFDGYPAFADPQNQTFYPLNIIMSFLTDFSAKAVYLQLILHYILAGLFMYMFIGFYVKNSAGRLTVSLIYMFDGYMMSHFQHLTMINSVTWLPLVLFFLEKGWRTENIAYFFPAGLSYALLIFAGHPQTLLYVCYLTVAYAIFKCFVRSGSGRFSIFPVLLLILSIAFGIMLGAVQLVPSSEFSQLANRHGQMPYEVVTLSGQLPALHIATLLLPDYVGGTRGPYMGATDLAHASIYCGVVFLVLLPFSFVKARMETYFFAFMALVSLLLSMGEHGLIFRAAYNFLPGFDMFRSPAHFRFAFGFFAALLTGIGIENISQRRFLGNRASSGYYVVLVSFVLFLLTIPLVTNFLKPVLRNILLDGAMFIFLSIAICLVLFFWKRRSISLPVTLAALLLLTFFDFFYHFSDSILMGPNNGHQSFESEPPAVLSIQNKRGNNVEQLIKSPFLTKTELDEGLYRVYVDDDKKNHTDFNPYMPYEPFDYQKLGHLGFNRAILHKMFLVDGYNPMILKRYGLFNGILRDSDYAKFLMLSNAKYIVKPDGSLVVLPRDETLPRAYLVTDIALGKYPDSILGMIAAPSFDVRKKAVVESPFDVQGVNTCSDQGVSKIVEYSPGRMEVTTEHRCPSLLVISETYYPGWKVRIDEKVPEDAVKVNYLFMGALLPPGAHSVHFEFDPKSLRVGLLVSSVALICGTVLALFVRKRRRQFH